MRGDMWLAFFGDLVAAEEEERDRVSAA